MTTPSCCPLCATEVDTSKNTIVYGCKNLQCECHKECTCTCMWCNGKEEDHLMCGLDCPLSHQDIQEKK